MSNPLRGRDGELTSLRQHLPIAWILTFRPAAADGGPGRAGPSPSCCVPGRRGPSWDVSIGLPSPSHPRASMCAPA
jgi:hypothetical protein